MTGVMFINCTRSEQLPDINTNTVFNMVKPQKSVIERPTDYNSTIKSSYNNIDIMQDWN